MWKKRFSFYRLKISIVIRKKLANARQQSLTLTVSQEEVSTDFSAVKLPPSVKVDKTYQVNFDKAGGNSSLAKLTFQTSDKEFNYQYI